MRLDQPGDEVAWWALLRCRLRLHLRRAVRTALARDAHQTPPARSATMVDRLRDDRPDRHAGEHVARVVHAEHQPGQRHWRHQHRGQRQAGGAGQQHRRRGGRRRMCRREAQPARRTHVDGDRRVVRAFAPDHALDHHRGGMGEKCARARRRAMPAAARAAAGHRAPRRDEPADAVLAEMRESPCACQHAGPIGERRLHGHQCGFLAARAAIGSAHLGHAATRMSHRSTRTVSHFCLLVSTGSASR